MGSFRTLCVDANNMRQKVTENRWQGVTCVVQWLGKARTLEPSSRAACLARMLDHDLQDRLHVAEVAGNGVGNPERQQQRGTYAC